MRHSCCCYNTTKCRANTSAPQLLLLLLLTLVEHDSVPLDVPQRVVRPVLVLLAAKITAQGGVGGHHNIKLGRQALPVANPANTVQCRTMRQQSQLQWVEAAMEQLGHARADGIGLGHVVKLPD